jgi:SAM-dependent methyltransferase
MLAHHRYLWSLINAEFTDRDAPARWAESGVRWGLFRQPDDRLGLLGDVRGLDVAELGCGTAFLSAALARAGAHPVGVDLSRAQLATAQRCQDSGGVRFPLIEATAERVPLRGGTFDVVVSEYGAAPWCEPHAWLREAARLLRPAGRLLFLTNSVLSALCVPSEGGVAGDRLLREQRAIADIDWPGGGTEHHPSHAEWIGMLNEAGFVIDALHELWAPPDALAQEFYDIVTPEWASHWPAEDVWVAHIPDDR